MQVIVTQTPQDVANYVANKVIKLLESTRAPVLGLATGSTPLELYRELVSRYRQGSLGFAHTTTFNLDEYIGLPPDHPQSYRYFMQTELFDHIDIDPANTFLPDGMGDPETAGDSYEQHIAEHGGIDLQILGIGRNGHIGFNEPTSSLGSRTRVKALTENTLSANARFFKQDEFQPKSALTMGIATILDTRQAILLATGEGKARAVAKCIEGPLSAMVPASALQLHRNAIIVVDEAAASKLTLTDYYRFSREVTHED